MGWRVCRCATPGSASVMARTPNCWCSASRGRAGGVERRAANRQARARTAASALGVARANVGDIGFNLDEVDLAMSPLSERLLDRFDIQRHRERRIENYRRLDTLLDPSVARVFPDLPEGTCPLFFPIFVGDKHAAAGAPQRGVDALEFWNDSSDRGRDGRRREVFSGSTSSSCRFIRT